MDLKVLYFLSLDILEKLNTLRCKLALDAARLLAPNACPLASLHFMHEFTRQSAFKKVLNQAMDEHPLLAHHFGNVFSLSFALQVMTIQHLMSVMQFLPPNICHHLGDYERSTPSLNQRIALAVAPPPQLKQARCFTEELIVRVQLDLRQVSQGAEHCELDYFQLPQGRRSVLHVLLNGQLSVFSVRNIPGLIKVRGGVR